ncbi:hypothetical protein GQ53DRAFT_657752 [Thozetella sp. PMI_491]|nr:hypothetical protein GQ53DRAFT_657752 [Thozetella sp. PMI_491]
MGVPRFRVRNWRRLVPLAFLFLFLAYHALPYHSHHRLRVHLYFYVPLQRALTGDKLLSRAPPYPIDLAEDVALIIKSGYGTKDRLQGTLQFLSEGGPHFNNITLTADFATQPGKHYSYNGVDLPVHDVVRMTIDNASERPTDKSAPPRLEKYARLQEAISKGDDELARSLSAEFGWELDAMKFISSLEVAYDRFPNKKWYILADDDTYLVRPSVSLFLGQFRSEDAHYLGNAVGGWEGRFAHGGSAIMLSQGAMRRLFVDHPRSVALAHKGAFTNGMGDSLLAWTFVQLGIYLEEGYSVYFGGEKPIHAKIRMDRFCWPVLNFHGLRGPLDTLEVDRKFRKNTKPTLWLDIWKLYGAPSFDFFDKTPLRDGWDHVGRRDESTTSTPEVEKAEDCAKMCAAHPEKCIAWSWEKEGHYCHESPWMMVGGEAKGMVTGLNLPRARQIAQKCGVP